MSALISGLVVLLIATAYFSYRYAWWRKALSYQHPRILMYHMVREPIKGAKFNSLRVRPADFEKQLRYLRNEGWTFKTMSELIKNKDKLPEKCVALTFDDGYADNFHQALPLLQKYDAKATIYLVVDRHDREWSSKRKKKNFGNELKDEPKLSDEQVRAMIASGIIEFGSHTLTHDNLSVISRQRQEEEITASRHQLQQLFDIPCDSFCYPFGLYDEETMAVVKAACYSNATTVEKGINCSLDDPFRLKRITISGKDNFYAFRLKLRTGKRGIKK